MPGPEELFKQKQQQNQIFKTTDEIQYKHSFKNPFDNNPFDNNMQVKKSAKTTDSITTDEQEKEIFKNKLENVVSDNEELQNTWNKVEEEFDLEVLQNRLAEFNLFSERHTSKENSARLKKTMEENHPDLFKGIKARKVTELKYRPERSALVKTFAAEFRDVVTHEERLKKQRNKRSELHRKLVNKEAINNSEENVMNSRMDMLTKVIDSSQVIPEAQELSDLACFMTGIEAEDQRLVEEFLGKNEKYGPDKYEGRDVSKAMDRMVIQLLDVDVSKLRLDNDEEIAKNSEKLELVSRRMAAFDRLNKEYGYLNSIGDMGALVTERLNALRYIANYYELKKDVMNDKVYYEHYNRELSMDYTKDGLTAGQKNLAQKLSELYKLGKLMMEHNGVRTDIIAKRGEPEYSDVTKVVSHYTSFGNKYNNEESAAKTLSDRRTIQKTVISTNVWIRYVVKRNRQKDGKGIHVFQMTLY